ncbi:MAG: DNA polymerase III subunit gamma/tau [Candidatus Omnitrophica bacterium]|nr:DNA polymerase III subunit gamma/tau [Candidatus Omnitrophota bacterium]MBU1928911.1 DNA polymerase III subunit gamma/tau [Candidatus Omnitrophota bacterium]MBU2222324.1 DNA polymerase III subunit gamma/tau [Candidatus Omnitrophota bacterium]MBU2258934.1 DNA polymerase III subunit gamma/tau [Candidatus Omnitrophota bacterium]
MSYTVFALKWRPTNFEEVIGQNHIITTLTNSILKNRLAHAYLFSGPRGVGKTSCARILAKAMNCQEGPTAKPCGKCPSCIDIAASRSLDVIEIDGASNRGIDEIRALRENVKFSPTQGKYKVYIIDEVHQITPEGFNALLKTLEEPPAFVKFIFATTHPQKVPSTILSRCQRMDFRRISVMEIIEQLEKIAKFEKISVDKEVLAAIARSSDGALRDAESVFDQLISFSKGKISLEDVVSMLGIVEQNALFEIARSIKEKDPKAALELFNRIIDEGKDITQFLNDLIEHFRNLMIAKVSKADPQLIDLPKETCDKLLEQSHDFSLEEIFNVFNILMNAQEMSRRTESLRIPLEIGLVKLSYNPKSLPASEPVVKAVPQQQPLQSPFKERPQPVIEKKEVKKAEEHIEIKEDIPIRHDPLKVVPLESIKEVWQNIISEIGKIKMSAATYLNEVDLVGIQDNILTLCFPKNCSFHKESMEAKENKDTIERKLSDLFKTNIRVIFTLSKEEKHAVDSHEHPAVKSALDMFNGRVIKAD